MTAPLPTQDEARELLRDFQQERERKQTEALIARSTNSEKAERK